jgi:hypothetical protein
MSSPVVDGVGQDYTMRFDSLVRSPET